MSLGTDSNHSCYCECRFGLPRLPGVRPGNGHPIYTRLVEVTRIHGDGVWVVHHDSWFDYLVRDAEDEKQLVPSMGKANARYPKSPATRGAFLVPMPLGGLNMKG